MYSTLFVSFDRYLVLMKGDEVFIAIEIQI